MKSYCYESIDSTNEEAKRLIQSGTINNFDCVVAKEQTHGKGTRGKKWISPYDGGIYLSLVHLRKNESFLKPTTLYTLTAGMACIEAVKEVCGVQTFLKPVNDIYFDGKKLGGILTESQMTSKGIVSLITGIGINTKKTPRTLDMPDIEPVSIEEILSEDEFKLFSKDKLQENIINKVNQWYEKIFQSYF